MISRLVNSLLSLAVVVWLLMGSVRDASADLILDPVLFAERPVGCGRWKRVLEPLTSFDSFYGTWDPNPQSQTELRSMHYNNFSFVAADWRDNMVRKHSGWDAPTDVGLPYARTMNALHVLAYGVSNTSPNTRNLKDPNYAMWAYRDAYQRLDNLRANCDYDAFARADWGWKWYGYRWKKITVKRLFYYTANVVERAAIMVHEARHIRGMCEHQGTCQAGASCDPSFENGCVGKYSGSGMGANGRMVVWYAWFLHTARPGMINDVIRKQTVASANDIINNRFGKHPGVEMHSNGVLYEARK